MTALPALAVAPDRVAEIRRLEAAAEGYEREAEACRWAAARLIAAELDAGKSQRQLAREIGKSHTHVGTMAAVWRLYGGNQVATEEPWARVYGGMKQQRAGTGRTGVGRPKVPAVATARDVGAAVIRAQDQVLRYLAAANRDDPEYDATASALRSRHQLLGRLLAGDRLSDADPVWAKWRTGLLGRAPRSAPDPPPTAKPLPLGPWAEAELPGTEPRGGS